MLSSEEAEECNKEIKQDGEENKEDAEKKENEEGKRQGEESTERGEEPPSDTVMEKNETETSSIVKKYVLLSR